MIDHIVKSGRKVDGRENWDPKPPYGMDQGYERDPGYAPKAYSPGYDYDTIPNSPYGYEMPLMDYQTLRQIDDEGAKGLGLASMIIGIVSIGVAFIGGSIFPLVCLLPLVSSIVGFVLGGLSLSRYKNTGATDGKGMAIAGVITNSVCLFLCVTGLIVMILFFWYYFGGLFY